MSRKWQRFALYMQSEKSRYEGARGLLRWYADLFRAMRSPRYAIAHLLFFGGFALVLARAPHAIPIWAGVGGIMVALGFQIVFTFTAMGLGGTASLRVIANSDPAILEAERLRRRLMEREAEIEARVARASAEGFASGLWHGRRGHYVVDFEDGLDETA